jgi:hypothetical protein
MPFSIGTSFSLNSAISVCLIMWGRNSQFGLRSITQSLISSLNYENDRFGPQTFASGSVSSLNYKNGRFGPQTFASDSNSFLADSQIPFFTLFLLLHVASCWRTRCSLCSSLLLSSLRRTAPPVWRLAAPPNPPRQHLLLRRFAQILGAAAAEAGHGWGVGTLGEGGARPMLHLSDSLAASGA